MEIARGSAGTHKAKRRFLRALTEMMEQRRWTQKDVAELTGMSRSTISNYLRDPDTITSGFIRKISVLVPAMALEYRAYRTTVDGALLDKKAAADVLEADERAELFDAAVAQISDALDALRKLLK